MSEPKIRKKLLKWIIYYPILVVVCLEVALLILGYRRYQDDGYTVDCTPQNAFIANDSLGISLNPGKFDITLNDAIHFKTEHLFNNRRLTPHDGVDNKPKIAFLGCSFTYGYGVNNEETFVAQLQKDNPSYGYDNCGVVGYGTVQSLLELPSILNDTSVKLVLLNFSSYHFMRNVLSEQYRRNLKTGYANSNTTTNKLMQEARFPYLTDCSKPIEFVKWEELHDDWYGRNWMASINWIQTLTENYIDRNKDELAITVCLIKRMIDRCKDANVKFGIVCLDQTSATDLLHQELGQINWVDIGFDFEDPSVTLLPFDSHPSANGHLEIAKKIEPFITSLLRHE